MYCYACKVIKQGGGGRSHCRAALRDVDLACGKTRSQARAARMLMCSRVNQVQVMIEYCRGCIYLLNRLNRLVLIKRWQKDVSYHLIIGVGSHKGVSRSESRLDLSPRTLQLYCRSFRYHRHRRSIQRCVGTHARSMAAYREL